MSEQYITEELMQQPIVIEAYHRSNEIYCKVEMTGSDRKKVANMNIGSALEYVLANYERDSMADIAKRDIEETLEQERGSYVLAVFNNLFEVSCDDRGNVLTDETRTSLNDKRYLRKETDASGNPFLRAEIRVGVRDDFEQGYDSPR